MRKHDMEERQGQKQEIEGDVPESDVEEPKPEWRQETQLQETNEKTITESEKEAINQDHQSTVSREERV